MLLGLQFEPFPIVASKANSDFLCITLMFDLPPYQHNNTLLKESIFQIDPRKNSDAKGMLPCTTTPSKVTKLTLFTA